MQPVRREFQPQLLRVRGQGVLRDRIRAEEPARRFGRERADVDQVPARGQQMPRGRARAANGSQKVQVPHLLKFFRSGVDGLPARGAAGIVDEHVDPAEFGGGLREQPIDVLLLRHVAGNRHDLAARRTVLPANIRRRALQQVQVPRGDNHMRAVGGEALRDGAAQARRAAGNHDNFFLPVTHGCRSRSREPSKPSSILAGWA